MAKSVVPGWNVIRRLGEHRQLNSAAILAVIAVPAVAGLWPAIRGFLSHHAAGYADLPMPLALGFFAGLMAIAGRAVYLNRATYVIRDYQREEYVYKLIQGYKAEPTERHLASLLHAIENFHGHPGRPPGPCGGAAPRCDAERYEMIRRYAEYHYDAASRADPLGRGIAALLYGGVAVLGLIIGAQLVLLVARQAGMLRILGIAP
jgi:hypothetical protein